MAGTKNKQEEISEAEVNLFIREKLKAIGSQSDEVISERAEDAQKVIGYLEKNMPVSREIKKNICFTCVPA